MYVFETIYIWVTKFKNRQSDIKDEQRPEAPSWASTDAIFAKTNNIISISAG